MLLLLLLLLLLRLPTGDVASRAAATLVVAAVTTTTIAVAPTNAPTNSAVAGMAVAAAGRPIGREKKRIFHRHGCTGVSSKQTGQQHKTTVRFAAWCALTKRTRK